jgi:hypothetical protein
MPSFEIDPKELWIAALRKAGLTVVTREDGTRWVDIDALWGHFAKVRRGIFGGPVSRDDDRLY